MGDWYMSRQLTSGVLGRKKADVWLYKGEVWEYEEVTNPTTGRTWMDRNLGASRVAQSTIDALAYGDLFQWGRLDDGHQDSDSLETSVLSNSDVPDNDGKFITNTVSPFDWRDPSNDNLWQPPDLINIPAPKGWRLPTLLELQEEVATWDETANATSDAFNSVLKIPRGGYRESDGVTQNQGQRIYIWTSTTDGTSSFCMRIISVVVYFSYKRASAMSVRLIKEI